MTIWLCNNCNNLDHPKMYGRADAFYDLYAEGRENGRAGEFKTGDICLVLSRGRIEGTIVVEKFTYVQKVKLVNAEGKPCWALCGTFARGDILQRDHAEGHEVYRYFFNVNGDICQWSAVRYNPGDQ